MKTHTIHTIEVEAASLTQDARRAFDAAGEHCERLGHIAEQAYQAAVADAFSDAEPEDLEQRATALVTCALSACAAAIELGVQAGRLRQLANVRRGHTAVEPYEKRDDDEEDES